MPNNMNNPNTNPMSEKSLSPAVTGTKADIGTSGDVSMNQQVQYKDSAPYMQHRRQNNMKNFKYSVSDDGQVFVNLNSRTLVLTPSGKKSYKIEVWNGTESRYVPFKGQQSRIGKLIKAIEAHDKGTIKNITKSLMDWTVETIKVVIYLKVADNKVKFLKVLDMPRRTCYLNANDKLAYVLDKNINVDIDDVATAIDAMDNIDDISKHISYMKIDHKSNMVLLACMNDLRDRYDSRLRFLGGNPNAGLFLASCDTLPCNSAQAQKLAKIKLSGGTIFDLVEMQAKLVDLSAPDGKVFLVSDEYWNQILQFGLLPADSQTLQVRMYRKGKYAMKGTGSRALNRTYYELLGNNDIVVDLKSYNACFGTKKKLGDIVTLYDLMVLRSDAELGIQDIHISNQAMDRMPAACKLELIDLVRNTISETVSNWKSNPLSQLSDFGMFKKFKALGFALESFGSVQKVEEKKFDSIEAELEDLGQSSVIEKKFDLAKNGKKNLVTEVKSILKKGISVKGAGLMLEYALGLKRDEVLLSRTVAHKMGWRLGDRVTILAYPILMGHADGSPSLFSLQVAGFLPGNTIAMNPETALIALRDYDGDVIFATSAFDAPPQKDLDYSKSKKGANPILLNAYSEEHAIDGYILNASEVGILDNLYTNVDKLETLSVAVREYCMNVIQASVFKMKHLIDAKYGKDTFVMLLQKWYPNCWETKVSSNGTEYLSIIRHPDVELRKGDIHEIESLVELIHTLRSVKGLTEEFAYAIEPLNNVIYTEIDTVKPDSFRRKAESIYVSLADKYTDSMRQIRDDIVSSIFDVKNDDIEIYSGKIRELATMTKAAIGAEAFYLLVVSLVADKRFKSLFIPWTFGDIQSLRDINDGKAYCTAHSLDNVVLEIAERSVKLNKLPDTIQIWRSAKDGGNSVDINIADAISVGDNAIVNGVVYNIEWKKSNTTITGDLTVASVVKVGTTGFIVEVVS